ncbi:MAG: protoporphyrinogen oxidase [Candidatus Acidiferrum sp.]
MAGYTERVVIIGAGISGLTCAYRLKQLGIRSLVLEAKERAGGVIATIRRNGFLFEAGPQCPRFPASVWRLLRDLNLQSKFVPGDPKAKRYILRHGRLHPAPFSPAGLVTTRLVGPGSKFRILTEAFRSSRPPLHEESLAEFVQRKFGDEVLDNLVDPLIATIFLGDSYKMGMESAFPALVEWERNQGSLVRGAIRARKTKQNARKTGESSTGSRANGNRGALHVTDALPSLGSFTTGMGTLPEKLAEELQPGIRYNAEIGSVTRSESNSGAAKEGWEIRLAGGDKITAEKLVLAVPAYAAARLLVSSAPQLARSLQAIEYAPMCAVSSAYDRSQVAHALDGLGFMVPRRERLQTICTFWNSSLFPQRAPEGRVLMTSFARTEANDNECAQIVEAESAKTLGITGGPVDRLVWKDSHALPQYNVGHAQRVTEIASILRAVPNLYLAGNFLRGRSIGDCVEVAVHVAEEMHSHLRGNVIQTSEDFVEEPRS